MRLIYYRPLKRAVKDGKQTKLLLTTEKN